jgi:hypothetical protein
MTWGGGCRAPVIVEPRTSPLSPALSPEYGEEGGGRFCEAAGVLRLVREQEVDEVALLHVGKAAGGVDPEFVAAPFIVHGGKIWVRAVGGDDLLPEVVVEHGAQTICWIGHDAALERAGEAELRRRIGTDRDRRRHVDRAQSSKARRAPAPCTHPATHPSRRRA